MRLYSYTMTYDEGFAPNPYHGFLTLATCKPRIRCSSKVIPGVWIAGWSGKRLQRLNHYHNKRLVYLARITEKITFAEYWTGEKYQCKKALIARQIIPNNNKGCGSSKTIMIKDDDIRVYGDNIYDDKGRWHSNTSWTGTGC